jgi:hypothetical protein
VTLFGRKRHGHRHDDEDDDEPRTAKARCDRYGHSYTDIGPASGDATVQARILFCAACGTKVVVLTSLTPEVVAALKAVDAYYAEADLQRTAAKRSSLALEQEYALAK